MPDEKETLLDEDFLRRLEKLKLLSQKGIRGQHRGENVSWRSGASLEFLDYRKYQLGDDFRYIDWNVYGRLDRLFIKLFRAEENQNIHVLIDMSKSMGAGNPSKDLFAKKIAAAIIYVCLTNLNSVSLTSFSDRLLGSITEAKSRQAYSKFLNYLINSEPDSLTDFDNCLTDYAITSKRSGIAIVLSDVLDPKGFEKGIDALLYSRYKVTLIQVLNSNEILPDIKGNYQINDIETGDSKEIIIDRNTIKLYQDQMNKYLERIKIFCLKKEIDYYLYNTSIAFETFLIDYIKKGLLFK